VREFWSATVYSLKTSSFFLNATRPTLGSLDKELRKNADGTVDIYFGPKPPAGQEPNWLYTQPGQKWFPWFRVETNARYRSDPDLYCEERRQASVANAFCGAPDVKLTCRRFGYWS